jgi:hypothetical protein
MNYQHKELAQGRWYQFSFIEQMANIGSEVERALNWKARNNTAYCQQAFERILELLDLTLADARNHSRLRELTRVREAIVDFFFGVNQMASTEGSWRKYFSCFTYAARKNY